MHDFQPSEVRRDCFGPCAGGMGNLLRHGGRRCTLHAAAGHAHHLQPEGGAADSATAGKYHSHAPTATGAYPLCAYPFLGLMKVRVMSQLLLHLEGMHIRSGLQHQKQLLLART